MEPNSNNNQWLSEVKQAPIRLMVSLILVHIAFTLFINLVIFEYGYLDFVYEATSGWINVTLTVNLIGLLLEVVILLCIIGGLSLRDVGIRKEKLVSGLIGTLLFWISIHVLDFIMTFISNEEITFNQDLFTHPNVVLGGFFGQIFGNALLEEIVFRGFLFVQILLLLTKHYKLKSPLFIAMLLSQSIFAIIHIPNRIYSGLVGMEYVYDFIQLVILGVIFSLIYVLTKNLFFVIGIHALLNEPPMLLDSSFANFSTLIGVLLLVGLLFWKSKKYHNSKINLQNSI